MRTIGAMPHRETYRNTLQYALALVGSERELAVRLRVAIDTLTNWLGGVEQIPDTVFLDSVDVIVKATHEELARARASP